MSVRENYLVRSNTDSSVFARLISPPASLPSERITEFVDNGSIILDCGLGLRDKHELVSSIAAKTESLDIFDYGSYPTILFDLTSDPLPRELKHRFDVVFCYSILEHVKDPFIAAKNLSGMVRPGGKIVGYLPWLFPHHSGKAMPYGSSQAFGDYWRFSAESYEILFSRATEIELYPVRGRLSTAMMLAFFTQGKNLWKSAEKRFAAFRWISKLSRKKFNLWQSSGYEFVVTH